jgi:hypothetical protein
VNKKVVAFKFHMIINKRKRYIMGRAIDKDGWLVESELKEEDGLVHK